MTIAARGIEAALNLQRFALLDGDECTRGFERCQFVVVLNARQIEAVDFFVLPDQRIVGRAEHGVPEQSTMNTEAERVQDAVVVVRVDAMQSEGGSGRREGNEHREHDQRSHERSGRFGAFQALRYESRRHALCVVIASLRTTSGLWKSPDFPRGRTIVNHR